MLRRMAARVFLGLSALVWLPYGIYCFLRPESLAEAAGIAASTLTGTTELRAMYGGLQAAIGSIALAGALRPPATRFAVSTLAIVALGLGGARLVGATLDGAFSSYTIFALGLELGTLAIAGALLRRTAPAAW
jgi:hypothetical protein